MVQTTVTGRPHWGSAAVIVSVSMYSLCLAVPKMGLRRVELDAAGSERQDGQNADAHESEDVASSPTECA